MVKKSAHPDIQLFEYLNGALDATAAQVIEAHLSVCEDCASAAVMIRALKEAASESNRESENRVSGEHPDISELASFFYARSRLAGSTDVAAHVALCSACAEAIAEYARAESAAAAHTSPNVTAGAVPARAWEMIRDWEDSSFAKLKPASEVIGQELLTRLSLLFDEETPGAREPDYTVSGSQPLQRNQQAERVPVLIVSRSGEVRSVEYFDKLVDSTGASVLKHAEGSERFNNSAVHALFDLGEKQRVVVSEVITLDTFRLERVPRSGEKLHRADYFIIED